MERLLWGIGVFAVSFTGAYFAKKSLDDNQGTINETLEKVKLVGSEIMNTATSNVNSIKNKILPSLDVKNLGNAMRNANTF